MDIRWKAKKRCVISNLFTTIVSRKEKPFQYNILHFYSKKHFGNGLPSYWKLKIFWNFSLGAIMHHHVPKLILNSISDVSAVIISPHFGKRSLCGRLLIKWLRKCNIDYSKSSYAVSKFSTMIGRIKGRHNRSNNGIAMTKDRDQQNKPYVCSMYHKDGIWRELLMIRVFSFQNWKLKWKITPAL